ncbi:MAG: hypothetical protein K0S12_431 [Bacteroidetes bacterium]|nr:hypothetical protein [Bacteroidota bacterium]
MIGNPYPCAIDWSSASWTRNKINDAVYIWNPQLQQYASYVSGVSVNGGSPIIASSQSFWIQANATSPSLACNENVKHTGTAAFVRPINQFLTNLKLSFSGNNYSDETVIRFGSPATKKFDKETDARKMYTTSTGVPSICSLDSTLTDMSVNSLPDFNNEVKIPLKTLVASGYSGNYTIKVDSTSQLPSGYCVVLEDLATGTITNLNNTSSYSFFISDTTSKPRFMIHMRASHQVNATPASCNGSATGKIVAEAKGQGPWNYIWFDGTNTVVKATNNTMGKDSLENIAAGNYGVYILGGNNMCGSSINSVTVSQPDPVIANFQVQSSTIHISTQSLTVQNISYNATSYVWNFGDGSPQSTAASPPPHAYNSIGQHTVVLVAANGGCASTFSQVVTVTSQFVQGIEESVSDGGLKVYPNPGDGLFNFVAAGRSSDNQLEVFDAAGRKIYSATLKNGSGEIDLRNESIFSAGNFFLFFIVVFLFVFFLFHECTVGIKQVVDSFHFRFIG